MRLIIEHTLAGGVYAYLEKESHFKRLEPLRLEQSERRTVRSLNDECELTVGTHVAVRVDKKTVYSE
jgi:hypothetical protein